MPTNPTPADRVEPDMPNANSREWPEAADAEPIVPALDAQAILRKHDEAKALKLAAEMMDVTEDAVRDAAYVKHHDKALFQLVFTGEVHLDDAKEILAGNTTVEQARELAPIRHALDRMLEKAEKNPEILDRLEALIAETNKAAAERKANVSPDESGDTSES